MDIFNDTPYPVATTVFKAEANAPLLSLIVKGTFRLVPDEPCEALPADEQPPLMEAVYYEDDFGNSLRSAAEKAPFKPRADCLLIGSCHAPHGEPVPASAVVFAVGDMRKTLWIYGDRHWVHSGLNKHISSDPEPFRTIPIRNEFAHGGLSSQYNKHGIGLADGRAPADPHLPLANIQNDHKTHEMPDDDVVPAGLGPLDPGFLPRRPLGGTYDEAWVYRRSPLPPRDFDYGFFNDARPDQQVEGYLRGDEPLYFQNLHPEHAHLNARLPGRKVRCFLLRHVVDGDEQRVDFLEAEAYLDTCQVDMEAETVTLIWRARAPLDPTGRSDYTFALVAQEPVDTPRDVAHYRARIKSLVLDRLGIAEPPPKPDPAKAAETQKKRDADVNARIIEIFEKGKAPPEMVEIVKTTPDPMRALEKMIDHGRKMVDGLPKPPK